MAFFDSELSVFQITDTGANLRDISAYITSIDGLPGVRDLNVATALGDGGEKFHPTLERVTITIELMWSDDALVGPDTVFGPLRTHTSAVAFDYGPEGKGTAGGGDEKYSGNCWVRDYAITSRSGNMVTARVELKVDGKVTRGNYT